MSKDPKQRVVFFHPDLGIGGAERLVVDAAIGLQKRGHQITIFTSHCDPTHCFEEARDGTLDVRVRGNKLFPASVLDRFSILCAILRQLHLIAQISVFTSELADLKPDVFFVDQLSACIPLLRMKYQSMPVLFYCHFPDKLLAARASFVKKLYRVPFDWWESWSTGCSSAILVNSNFTKAIFTKAFPDLRHKNPEVVYPCVDTSRNDNSETLDGHPAKSGPLWKHKKVLLSINRFERKKDVGLAIRAYAGLNIEARREARLIIAGGYDLRIQENVSHHKELCTLSESAGLQVATARNLVSALSVPEDIDVLFLLSVPSPLKKTLLEAASLLIYTPKFEHFGIVPLEAMLASVPVLAAQTGGPRETVVEGKTGWLRNCDEPAQWTEIMRQVLVDLTPGQLSLMGEAGRQRAIWSFSRESMALRLDEVISKTLKTQVRHFALRNLGFQLALATIVSTIALGVVLQYAR